ncbi:hypothetical protein G4B88_024818 [Cannabis sativa]|uniref:Reverse transcriptase zinc-binding domain-containing protein n=1 Tax=Cannabis sativa TaxID=3483 RepID=A0A7J6DZ53_CANSA|nr:hypothetical protein G4B88_024818 [Cannabis sativa]
MEGYTKWILHGETSSHAPQNIESTVSDTPTIDMQGVIHDVFGQNTQPVEYARNIWSRMVLPKHRFIGWQVVNNQLLTRDNLSRTASSLSKEIKACVKTRCLIGSNGGKGELESYIHNLFFIYVYKIN